ncbi:unnamed protein product [Caenorhabditis bovis]|uniref:TM2 domain-containing protein n=1 Tax=Caenorhabditis bovis TaxID=2654633 RepID=A0A8S1EPJ8_9PELO|nr:unnamed protein product [Caenorhabditis bovis]
MEFIRLITYYLLIFIFFCTSIQSLNATIKCHELNKYQFQCKNYAVDPKTQQSITCAPDNSVQIMCETPAYIDCIGKDQFGFFNMTIENGCSYGAHLKYSTALLLSIFFGIFGLDRIYLGYYAIGVFKMFSFGGLLILWLVDVILIALQLLGPADGTSFFMAYYGPKISTNMNAEAQMQQVAELEVEMMSDMYKKMTNSCQSKCISTAFKESELTKGEAVCLDRCVAKYLDVHEKLGKRLTSMSQGDEAALQKMAQ